ncbi:MAG: hypothetical protein ACE5GW_13165, partial [Planctomycetota bacterium]
HDPLLADRHILGSIFYRQSLSFAGHVSRRHGEDVHRRILERLSRGEAFQRAFAAVCGEPLEEAEERWRGELRASFSWPAFIFRTVSLFHILAALVIVAFVLQMVRRRRALERMRRAEAPAASAVEEPGRRSEESEEKK